MVRGDARSPAVDDYVKAVYSLAERHATVTTSLIADRLGVSPSSVSGMVRRLVELGLVEHARYAGVSLTSRGTGAALAVLRRHRLLETFLVRELNYGWDEVHDEAEVLEHHISETLLARIDARLGHPRVDPHGDPIPDAQGHTAPVHARQLSTLEPGTRGRLSRVEDSDPAALRYLSERSISLGDTVELLERQPFGGPFRVRTGASSTAHEHDLGPGLAALMWIDTDVTAAQPG